MKKKLRFFSMALAILMILPLLAAFPITVSATDPVVYEVSNYSELVNALNAHYASKDPTEIIRLTDDIILESGYNSDAAKPYIYGTFDGQNHTIYNMTNDIKSLVWPYGDCLIENFTVSKLTAPDGEEFTVTKQTSLLGNEPTADEIKAGETSIIRNVTNERSITSGVSNYGGLFIRKFNIAGTIRFENCTNNGNYYQTNDNTWQLGGFIGYMVQGTVEFIGCVNNGNITGSNAGGFIAVYRDNSSTIRMTDCTNNGTIKGWNGSTGYGVAGGFIGGYTNDGTINYNYTIEMTNCVNYGDILVTGSGTRATGIGGLIGCSGTSKSGKNLSITLTKCRVENCTIDTNGKSEYAAPLIGKCSPGSVSTYKIEAVCCSVSNVDVIGGTARKLIGVVSATESTYPVVTACEFTNVREDGSATWNANALEFVKCVLMTPYAEISDGEELLDINFAAAYMEPDFVITGDQADNNDDLDVAVSDDGSAVTFTSLNANNKRGIWGGKLPADFFPLSVGVKYTVYYSLEMDAGMKCAFYPDGYKGIAIVQNSTYTQYQNWSSMSGSQANWANKTDYGANLTDFAVELDYDTGTLTLYGRNQNGTYLYINQATGLTFDSDTLYCAFWAGNTAGKTVTVSDVSIEKGLTVEELNRDAIGFTAYQAQADNALLQTVNFNRAGWNPGFADTNNKGADVTILGDNSVHFVLHNGDNYRAMWGAELVDTLPLLGTINGVTGVEYTFVFDVEFGNEEMLVGIMPDADNALMIQGNGAVQWFRWNTPQGTISDKWTDHTDVAGSSQTFAVVMDYSACSYALYVKRSNGSFEYVTSRTKDHLWDTKDTINFFLRVHRASGTPDATYTVTVSNVKIYKGLEFGDRQVLKTVTGAAVRLDTPTGLRFTGLVGKGYLDELKTTYGAANVKIGMIITPTDYLTDHSLTFTKEALDSCGAISGAKYVKIEAATILENDDGTAYLINCVLSDVLEANYSRAFSAITYVEINGSTYYYSSYNEDDNSRSISFVAEAALLDVSDTQTGDYQYPVEIESTTKYSPYTEVQRNSLAGFRCP